MVFEYKEFSKYYDLLYSGLKHKESSKEIIELSSKYRYSKGNDLLDVACGTGTHINNLKSKFSCTGIDLSEKLLDVAKKKSIDSRFEIGDMRNFKLNEEFDVITCLFNSMNYLNDEEDLEDTINNFYNHLVKGGIMIAELFHNKENFVNMFNHLRTYDGENIKIARIGEFEIEGNFVNSNMHYIISEKGKKIMKGNDTHKLRIFSKNKILSTMKSIGFKPIYLEKGFYGKGLFVGTKE